MKNSDFDKIFNHKLSQIPGAPYEEPRWLELSSRLDTLRRRQQFWLIWVIWPLIGLLAASNTFWWYQWRDLTCDRIAHAEPAASTTADTVIHRTLVIRYDTVYQTETLVRLHHTGRHLTTRLSASSPTGLATGTNLPSEITAIRSNPSTVDPAATGFESARPQGLLATGSIQDTLNQQSAPDPAVVQGLKLSLEESRDSFTQALPTAPEHETSSADSSSFALPPGPVAEIKRVRPHTLYLANPRLGVSGGLAIPNFPHKLSGAAWTVSIPANIEIAKNIRIGAQISYQQARLKADKVVILENQAIDIPMPGSSFQLKYWETYSLPAFSYGLYARYEIPLSQNWTPWLSLGGQFVTYLPYEVEFEYENGVNNIELHVPVKSKEETRWQGMFLRIGAEHTLKEHLLFGTEFFLLNKPGAGTDLLDHQYGFNSYLMYKF